MLTIMISVHIKFGSWDYMGMHFCEDESQKTHSSPCRVRNKITLNSFGFGSLAQVQWSNLRILVDRLMFSFICRLVWRYFVLWDEMRFRFHLKADRLVDYFFKYFFLMLRKGLFKRKKYICTLEKSSYLSNCE